MLFMADGCSPATRIQLSVTMRLTWRSLPSGVGCKGCQRGWGSAGAKDTAPLHPTTTPAEQECRGIYLRPAVLPAFE